MNHDGQKCLTCAFCELLPELSVNSQGICRLFPPTMQMVPSPQGAVSMAMATLVRVTVDWCAQHELQLVKPVSGMRIEK